jgi:hypothetical protein
MNADDPVFDHSTFTRTGTGCSSTTSPLIVRFASENRGGARRKASSAQSVQLQSSSDGSPRCQPIGVAPVHPPRKRRIELDCARSLEAYGATLP